MKTEKTPETATQEKYFLNTFPLMNFLILQKLNSFYSDYLEDIKQKVALNLWKWKIRRPDKNLSEEEWAKLANTSTCNEIKRFHSDKMSHSASLSDISENNQAQLSDVLQTSSPLGNTPTEAASLLSQIWQVIKEQTLREKFALLLRDRQIINHLISYKCCGIKEIAGVLELTTDEFLQLYRSLPFSDAEIGTYLGKKLETKVNAEQVSKARQRIRAKLASFQNNGKGKATNGQTSVTGENRIVSKGQTDG